MQTDSVFAFRKPLHKYRTVTLSESESAKHIQRDDDNDKQLYCKLYVL